LGALPVVAMAGSASSAWGSSYFMTGGLLRLSGRRYARPEFIQQNSGIFGIKSSVAVTRVPFAP